MQAIVDVLGNAVEYSELAEKICSIYTEQYPDGSVVMGLGQRHGTGRDGTVQDIFLIFLCPEHIWDIFT